MKKLIILFLILCTTILYSVDLTFSGSIDDTLHFICIDKTEGSFVLINTVGGAVIGTYSEKIVKEKTTCTFTFADKQSFYGILSKDKQKLAVILDDKTYLFTAQ
jgi:hypothetical protein